MQHAKHFLAIAAFAALVFLGFSAFTNLHTEPNSAPPGKKIMAVREAARNEFPFMVHIKVGDRTLGMGILISPEWVLTNASLVEGSTFADLTFGVHNTTDYIVGQGSESASVRVHVTSNDVTMHPNWNHNSLDNNVAVIRLRTPLTLSPAIQPINTIDRKQNWVGQAAQGVGWGFYMDNNVSKISATPQVVDVSMIEMQQAITAFEKSYNSSSQVAATAQTYTTTTLVTTGSGGTKLVGFLNEGQIGGGTAVYSRFDHFEEWIGQNAQVFFN